MKWTPTHPGTDDPVDARAYAWVRLMAATSERFASDPDVPVWLRVFHAALGRVDRYGLAHFERGELARVVAPITSDGEIGVVHHIGAAVDRCIGKGLLSPGSTPRRVGIRLDTASVGGYDHARLAV